MTRMDIKKIEKEMFHLDLSGIQKHLRDMMNYFLERNNMHPTKGSKDISNEAMKIIDDHVNQLIHAKLDEMRHLMFHVNRMSEEQQCEAVAEYKDSYQYIINPSHRVTDIYKFHRL